MPLAEVPFVDSWRRLAIGVVGAGVRDGELSALVSCGLLLLELLVSAQLLLPWLLL